MEAQKSQDKLERQVEQAKIELQEAQEKLTPQDYNEFLQSLNLVNLYLVESKSKLHSRKASETANVELREKTSDVNVIDDRVAIQHEYWISVKCNDNLVMELFAKYALEFELKGKVPDEFYTIYKNYTLPIQIFPYLRELVHSMTSKMDLPNLILPLRKNLVGDRKNE